MRYILITLLLLPMSALCQTKADYEHAMDRFVKYYNARQGDSIVAMWPPNEKKTMTHMWGDESVNDTYKDCGAITSYTYIGKDMKDPNKVAVFKVTFSKMGVKATSLTLDGKYLGTFRFITRSPEIDKMLKCVECPAHM